MIILVWFEISLQSTLETIPFEDKVPHFMRELFSKSPEERFNAARSLRSGLSSLGLASFPSDVVEDPFNESVLAGAAKDPFLSEVFEGAEGEAGVFDEEDIEQVCELLLTQGLDGVVRETAAEQLCGMVLAQPPGKKIRPALVERLLAVIRRVIGEGERLLMQGVMTLTALALKNEVLRSTLRSFRYHELRHFLPLVYSHNPIIRAAMRWVLGRVLFDLSEYQGKGWRKPEFVQGELREAVEDALAGGDTSFFVPSDVFGAFSLQWLESKAIPVERKQEWVKGRLLGEFLAIPRVVKGVKSWWEGNGEEEEWKPMRYLSILRSSRSHREFTEVLLKLTARCIQDEKFTMKVVEFWDTGYMYIYMSSLGTIM